jgi:hypothetical protein
MAKRGQLRPWKMRYEWPGARAGTDAFVTEADARFAAVRQVERVSPHTGRRDCTASVWHRDRPEQVEQFATTVRVCEWCDAELDGVDDPVDACEPGCDCPPCASARALDDDADAYRDRVRNP